MVELTRVIEAKITIIEKMEEREADDMNKYKAEAEKNVTQTLQQLYKADDVQVEIHDFIL